jgi:hypothetical protein
LKINSGTRVENQMKATGILFINSILFLCR